MTTILVRVPSSADVSEYNVNQMDQLVTPEVSGVILTEEKKLNLRIDATVLASWLGHSTVIPMVIETSVNSSDPYNLARRVLSLQQVNDAPVAVLLKPGAVDPLTESFQTLRGFESVNNDQDLLWKEYVEALRSLWGSFPMEALIADKASGAFSRPELLQPINFVGRTYQVAGPLSVPLDGQGIPEIWAEISDDTADDEISAFISQANTLILSSVQLLTSEQRERIIERQGNGELQVLRSVSSVELSTSASSGLAQYDGIVVDGWVIEASPQIIAEDIQAPFRSAPEKLDQKNISPVHARSSGS